MNRKLKSQHLFEIKMLSYNVKITLDQFVLINNKTNFADPQLLFYMFLLCQYNFYCTCPTFLL